MQLSFKQVVEIVKQLSPLEKQKLGEVLWTEQNIDDFVIPEDRVGLQQPGQGFGTVHPV